MNKPILVLGHARAGTTVLTGMINWHSNVYPKHKVMTNCKSVNDFLKPMSSWGTLNNHQVYSGLMEMKDFWFRFLPGVEVFAHMGKEMIYEECFTRQERQIILTKLVDGLKINQRVLFKSPSLSFSIEPIVDLFPDIKIVAIYREPLGCINSWRGIGTGKEYDINRISLLCRKWEETITYVEKKREKYKFLALTYDNLIYNTPDCLKKILGYCDLPYEDYVNDVKLVDKRYCHKKILPRNLKHLIEKKTVVGRELINEVQTNNAMEWY